MIFANLELIELIQHLDADLEIFVDATFGVTADDIHSNAASTSYARHVRLGINRF